jgi:hypothetical protein
MLEAALAIGGHIAMLATFVPSVGSMEDEFRDMAAAGQSRATIENLLRAGRDGRIESR